MYFKLTYRYLKNKVDFRHNPYGQFVVHYYENTNLTRQDIYQRVNVIDIKVYRYYRVLVHSIIVQPRKLCRLQMQ